MKTHYKITLFLIVLFSAVDVFAQMTREEGIELYDKGDYKGAERILEKAAKSNVTNARVWYYLGLTYLRLNERKEATKALEKAAALDVENAEISMALASVYFLRNDMAQARWRAQKALAVNPNIAEAHYIIGVHAFRNFSYEEALNHAKKAIEINPKYAAAYLLKSESLVSLFASGGVPRANERKEKASLLKEATEDLEKNLSLAADKREAEFQREYLESLKFFAEYYGRNQASPKDWWLAATETKTGIKILKRPQPEYPQEARDANVSGSVRLLVEFAADGAIKHILVVRNPGFGLDKAAIKAARKIKFAPPTENGKPVLTVRMVEYTFTLY